VSILLHPESHADRPEPLGMMILSLFLLNNEQKNEGGKDRTGQEGAAIEKLSKFSKNHLTILEGKV
jgi:hypothetical protein